MATGVNDFKLEPNNSSRRLEKRMHAANYYGDYLLVTPSYYTGWIAKNSGPLSYYLKYATEVRKQLHLLDDEPYVAELRDYARRYSLELEGNDKMEMIPWQNFIDADLLRDLKRPWNEPWQMSYYGLEPSQRIEGVPQDVLMEAYPRAEIQTEEEYDTPLFLIDSKISTVEYLRQFALPFRSTTELADWLFTPRYLPADSGSTEKTEGPYINLSRRERIGLSLEAIYKQLSENVLGLEIPGARFAGELAIPQIDVTENIILEIESVAESWERVKDIVGVMVSILNLLKEDPV
ncbi:hypothetical protein H072_11410 [Dactylellina haptotyla CBS 200.50]|uniref:Uncharacterized protein n=1 Tax=Dactylellina haptotyla (strain CBS 200.50) TaxID=1284197 RepID=S7ZXJ5_DACHA|nr:hypothetical protein H072_11410 [Dactylellina haptotyla CBS 200.50]